MNGDEQPSISDSRTECTSQSTSISFHPTQVSLLSGEIGGSVQQLKPAAFGSSSPDTVLSATWTSEPTDTAKKLPVRVARHFAYGKRGVVGHKDGSINVCDPETPILVTSFQTKNPVTALCTIGSSDNINDQLALDNLVVSGDFVFCNVFAEQGSKLMLRKLTKVA